MKAIIINGPMGVGNRETKTMAIDNILHMIGNYRKCSICKRILLVWLMDDEWVCQGITGDITSLGLEVKTAVLVCDNETLIKRWNNDKNCVDTSGLTIKMAADIIMHG